MCLARVGQVVELVSSATAVVECDGDRREISLAVLTLEGTDVQPGDWLLLHTGMAVGVLEEAEATEMADLHRAVAGAAHTERGAT